MEKTLQQQTTAQCSGLPPTGPRDHRPDGPEACHALTIKLDHSSGADHYDAPILGSNFIPFGAADIKPKVRNYIVLENPAFV